MTSAALTVNKEWNTKLISTENGGGCGRNRRRVPEVME